MDQDILTIHVIQEVQRVPIDLTVHLDLMLDMEGNIIIEILHLTLHPEGQVINPKQIIKVINLMMKINLLRKLKLVL